MNYAINYEDDRFKQVEAQKQEAINQSNSMYDQMINDSNQYYQNQIDAVNQYSETQQQLQNERTDQAINEINQQKERTEKDYQREQRGAYTDWQKESNRYGVNAEQQAASGLANTGYSESSQVAMYNTYQNRVATARESYQRAVQDYDNAITNARLTNNAALAEIAYNALQNTLELSLQGFQYKNQLLQTRLNAQQQLDSEYYQRYQNVLSQMNTENALAEQIRQYNTSLKEQQRQYNTTLAFQKEQAKQQQKNWEKEYALSLKASSGSSGSGSKGGSKGGSGGNNKKGNGDNNNVNLKKDTNKPTAAQNKKAKELESKIKQIVNSKAYNTNSITKKASQTQIAGLINAAYESDSITPDQVIALTKYID